MAWYHCCSVGGLLVSPADPELFIAQALSLVRSAFPTAKIYVFGAGGTVTFPAVFAFGADLGDSIGWRQAAGYGLDFFASKKSASCEMEH